MAAPPPAAAAANAVASSGGKMIPPVIRSCLTLTCQAAGFLSWTLRGAPGMQGGLMYKGTPYCFATGYRDRSRGTDYEDKGNHLRLRDPLCYHRLSVPILGQLLWILHQEKKLSVEEPLTAFLPAGELPSRFDRLTARDLLTYQVGIDDDSVYKRLGFSRPTFGVIGGGPRYHSKLWQPLREKFGEMEPGATAAASRRNLLAFLREEGEKLPAPRKLPVSNPRVSHTGFAVLAACIDRVMQKPFEEVMFEKVFQPLEALSVGYGVPAILVRTSIFFQPTGLSNGHYSFSRPVKSGDIRNTTPMLFNPSLNLFAQPEDFSKLLVTTLACAVKWTQEFPPATKMHPYHEMGMQIDPATSIFRLITQPTGLDVMPYCAAFSYNSEKDLGGFAVANCGSSSARITASITAAAIPKMFKNQVLDEGVDPFDEEGGKEVVERLKKQADANLFAKLFRKDSHSKF